MSKNEKWSGRNKNYLFDYMHVQKILTLNYTMYTLTIENTHMREKTDFSGSKIH